MPALVCGSAVGSAVAAATAVDLPEEQLRLTFSAFVLGLGAGAYTRPHFSPQPGPFLSPKLRETTQRMPQKCSRSAEKWTGVSPWLGVHALRAASRMPKP